MKKTRIAALGATILSLMFSVTISAYAQDEKPARQDEKAAQQDGKAAQEEKHPQKQEEGKDAQREDKQMGDEKQQKHEADQKVDQKHEMGQNHEADQKHVAREGNDNAREGKPGERAGGRIPDDRFREHFGREHVFVINRPVIVEGAPRFQYGGYWFVIANPWPVDWAYTDQVYVDYIDGEYYVLSPVHPGVRVLINVVL